VASYGSDSGRAARPVSCRVAQPSILGKACAFEQLHQRLLPGFGTQYAAKLLWESFLDFILQHFQVGI
jgi:hypothetical protein